MLPRDYRSADTTAAKILLLEGAGAVLGPFHPKLQDYTEQRLRKMGVDIRLNTLAVDMDQTSITVVGPDGEREWIRTRTRIWAAGVQASPLATMLAKATGAETDRAGRVAVNPDCTLPGHPEVFAIGDMVSLNKLPGVAQPAIQEGKYVGKIIRARLAGDTSVPPFKYFDKGSMATIGHMHAVADSRGLRFTGLLGYTVWGFIHVMYLVGWGNRLGTLYTWARALTFSSNCGHRVITVRQAHDEITAPEHEPSDESADAPDDAAQAGFEAVGLRIEVASPAEERWPMGDGSPMLAETRRRLSDTGLVVQDLEIIRVTPQTEPARQRPLFEIGAALGARFFNVMVDDPDLVRAHDRFAALCEVAEPYGLRQCMEGISYMAVRDLETALGVLSGTSGGLIVDPLHLQRCDDDVDELRRVDPAVLAYIQLCDGPLTTPSGLNRPDRLPRGQSADVSDAQLESRTARPPSGDGEMPLAEIVSAIRSA